VTTVLAVEPEAYPCREALENAARAPAPVNVVAGVADRRPAEDESVDAIVLHGEAGALNRRCSTPPGMAATCEGRPDGGVEQRLHPSERSALGPDVFEEAQLAAGAQHAATLGLSTRLEAILDLSRIQN
jgi:hypothetical protein